MRLKTQRHDSTQGTAIPVFRLEGGVSRRRGVREVYRSQLRVSNSVDRRVISLPDNPSKVLNRHQRTGSVNHPVAVGTQDCQITHRGPASFRK